MVQSLTEARTLKRSEVGSAHLRPGVLHEPEEIVTRVFVVHGVDY